jgi:CBS domain-containing protein
MYVRELMTRNPACCTPETTIVEVTRMMKDFDCGEIPVARADGDRKLVGVITDRDVVCRVVAAGQDPSNTSVEMAMSTPVVSVTPETTLDECLSLMESHQIRRVPVVDAQGICCGIVSQADVATGAPPKETAELVKGVSRPN